MSQPPPNPPTSAGRAPTTTSRQRRILAALAHLEDRAEAHPEDRSEDRSEDRGDERGRAELTLAALRETIATIEHEHEHEHVEDDTDDAYEDADARALPSMGEEDPFGSELADLVARGLVVDDDGRYTLPETG